MTVPVFDGRSTFTLGDYKALPRWTEEVPVGAAVFVTFTTHIYKHKLHDNRQCDTVSFNIQEVVVLEEPSSDFDRASLLTAEFGRNIAPGIQSETVDDVVGNKGSDDESDADPFTV